MTKKRRLIEAALFFLALVATAALVARVLGAWQQTQRQEAYLPQLEAQARRDPYNGPLLALTGGREMEAGDYSAAAATLRRAIGAGETADAVWQDMAAATAASGDPTRGIADLRIGIHNIHDAPLLQSALARVTALGPSATPFQVAQAICPTGPQPLLDIYGRGSFLNGLADWWGHHRPEESGYATRERWIAAEPNDAQAVRLWGLALQRNGRVPEAIAALRQAVALDPRSPDSHLALAGALEQAGLTSSSTLEYLAALKMRPNWLPALLGTGRTAQEQGLAGYTSAAFTQATRSAPDNADAWIGLGRFNLGTGSTFDQAVTDFRKAAALAPNRTDFYCDYAQALSQNNEWDQAEAVLRRRLAAAPDDPYAHYLLGMVLLDNRPTAARQAEAEDETRKALALAPHNAAAERQLAEILLDKDQPAEARDLLTDALNSDPYSHNTLLLLARVYRATNQAALSRQATARADALLRALGRVRVLEGDERDNTLSLPIHEELAALYGQLGMTAQATQESKIARMLKANPGRAAESLKAFHATTQALLPNE